MQINSVNNINAVMNERALRAKEEQIPENIHEKAPDYDKYEGRKIDKCTADTNKPDKEIAALKRKQTELENRKTQLVEGSILEQRLSKELSAVESELRLKDNDSYRRAKTSFKNE